MIFEAFSKSVLNSDKVNPKKNEADKKIDNRVFINPELYKLH